MPIIIEGADVAVGKIGYRNLFAESDATAGKEKKKFYVIQQML